MQSNLTQTFNTQTSFTEGNETSRSDIQTFRSSHTISTLLNRKFLHTTSFSHLIRVKEKAKDFHKKETPQYRQEKWLNGARMIRIHKWKYMCLIGLKERKELRDQPDIVTEEMLRKLKVIFGGSISQVQTLSIDPSQNHVITIQTLQAISEMWQRLECIQNLKLICNDSENYITNPGLKLLARGIATHMNTLKAITLNFTSCEQITDYGVERLASKIRLGLRDLNHLTLSFDRCSNLRNQSIEAITSQIYLYSKHLQSLELSFKSWFELTHEGLHSLSRAFIKNLTGLTRLKLDFESCSSLNGTGFEMILSSINFKSLLQLTFNFANCTGFENSHLQQLALCLGESASALQELNLNLFSCNKIKNDGLSLFVAQLKNLASLKHFRFKVSTSPIGHCKLNIDDLLKNPFGSQGVNLLQTLHLSFPGCQNLTDDGVISLGDFLSSGFVALKYLRLEFPRCRITDVGINKMFTDLMKGLTNLEILKADLSWCKGITLKSLEGLQSEISKRQTRLKKLVLCLFQCNIPREEVIKLKDKLTFIRHVRLS